VSIIASVCKTCKGKGYVLIPICDYDGVKYEKHTCLDCSSVANGEKTKT
jgi:hypothetical protein